MDSEPVQLQLTDDTDGQPKPWERFPDEPPHCYAAFLKYLKLGPRRSVLEAARLAMVESGELLPGQPLRQTPDSFNKWSKRYAWYHRAAAWDTKNWQEELAIIEENRRHALTEMIARHIEGWQVISEAAITNFFERDEDGNIIFDEDGQPKVRTIEDTNTALRAYRQAVAGERVARGLPAEIVAMPTEEIKQRIVDISRRLAALQEEEVIDGEYKELGQATGDK